MMDLKEVDPMNEKIPLFPSLRNFGRETGESLKRTYFAGNLPTKLTLIAIPLAALFAMLKDLLHL